MATVPIVQLQRCPYVKSIEATNRWYLQRHRMLVYTARFIGLKAEHAVFRLGSVRNKLVIHGNA